MNGERLKRLRKEKKLTQAELGKIINVTKVSISGYENGDRNPDTDNLRRLSDYFGVSSDYLLGRTDKPNYISSDNNDDEDNRKSAIIDKIKREFPDADPMFNDLASFTADDMEDVYDYIKYIKSKKKK
ncbi:helix-turn-helix domain-containing protein [Cytobacillus kochii]|uniref:helix-turn-helix domain-containing protein n=1 Tax=Cytobacillus kochii TaxID=859143 RepID=UPI00203C5D81|nr:helix-turn-helix transcriptional regulator [Cytobacillus kochii]MCM3324276.1 helix-turn-helix domain-containing protein [Cytobacillus kochii]MCM3346656.1 helix-turn-helix domain-containing protein [Cytobacillus kochii]